MSTEAWRIENTVRFNVRFVKNSGVPEALRKMIAETGETEAQYIRRVVTESLIRDGFLSKPEPVEK